MRSLLLATLMLANCVLLAQSQRANNWITGYSGNKINFTGNSITTSKGVYFPFKYFTDGNSCISDTAGNLLLVSDGFNVYNSTGTYLEGGDSLIPNDYYIDYDGWSGSSQTSIFLPLAINKYYFITPSYSDTRLSACKNGGNCYFDLLLYNIIDMNANGGAGKVTQRMIPLMQNANLRKTQMMACRHGNGKDWWLLKQEGGEANVHTFLFTQDSVYDKGVQLFNNPQWGTWDLKGQSTFNSDGSVYATTSHGGSIEGHILIADFDRCNGILNNSYTIQMPLGSQHNPNDTAQMNREIVGLCFSPNNQYLYAIGFTNIYQYDLQDSTWFHVAGIDTSYLKFQLYANAYLAPDNKIYIGNYGGLSKQMSRIDNPNVKGAGCNFCPRCLRLDSLGANAYVGTPPCMPNYSLGAKPCWPLDTPLVNADIVMVVYPNPAYSTLTIKNRKGKKKDLFNSVGQMIYATTKEVIDVSSLSKGVYFIKVEGEVKKVVLE